MPPSCRGRSSTAPTAHCTERFVGGASGLGVLFVLDPAGPTPPPAADTVAVTVARYRASNKLLTVQATSSSATATLKAYVTATGVRIGTLTNNGGGSYSATFSWPSNPKNITVRSSLGGSASRAVAIR